MPNRQLANEAPTHQAPPLGETVQPALEAPADRRWLLLLKVGKDELAGIWDGRLASCEPIVWRPATKSWAPLFEVPQIATLVSATVNQRQAASKASIPASSIPASPAPRRRQQVSVAGSERGRAPVSARSPGNSAGRRSGPPALDARAVLGAESPVLDAESPVRSGAESTVRKLDREHPGVVAFEGRGRDATLRSDEAPSLREPDLRPSRLAELGVQQHSDLGARLALRSPYIPPPPRVPSIDHGQVVPAYVASDGGSGTLPAAHVSGRSARQQADVIPLTVARARRYETPPPTLEPEPEAVAHVSAPRVAVARESSVPELESQLPADGRGIESYAPQVRSVAPPPARMQRGQVIERAGWLAAGAAVALIVSAVTGAGSSPDRGRELGAAAELERPAAQGASQAEPANTGRRAAHLAAVAPGPVTTRAKHASSAALAVEELPVLGQHDTEPSTRASEAALVPSATEAKTEGTRRASRSSRGKKLAASSERASSRKRGAATDVLSSGFNPAQAKSALSSAVARAEFCAAERATGTVVVTFAATGAVVNASLASISGEDVRKGCVVRAFRGARISPFQGDPVTVQKHFQLR